LSYLRQRLFGDIGKLKIMKRSGSARSSALSVDKKVIE
jgi:hypothetical protein